LLDSFQASLAASAASAASRSLLAKEENGKDKITKGHR